MNVEKENIIVENLKTACDEKGREVDYTISAQLLFELGQLYQKQSTDKICLIKSVGLLNAAILRDPSNVLEIKQELNNLCRDILQLAGAQHPNADLVQEAHNVKQSILDLRKDTRLSLDKIQTLEPDDDIHKIHIHEVNMITQMQQIQKILFDEYKQIMANIGEFCVEVLGEPPCKFSIAGMGSLARAEITPYSDFEHVILLEEIDNYEEHTEYFRWFSVIFHVIILCLHETLVPYLDVSCLDGRFYDTRTPCGVSFDGMVPHACKFPLGRQQHTKKKPFSTELIQPISKMLEYLTHEEDLKNGYYLKDILTKTCYVFGDRSVYDDFEAGVKTYYSKQSDEEVSSDVKQQVKDDLKKFATRLKLKNLKQQDNFNVKEIIYRSTTLFLSALGRMHKIPATSCFEIIQCLAEKEVISENTRHKLMFAVAVACQIRLKLYFANDSQFDFITVPRDTEKLKQFAGESNTRNYFQIAYCLQAEICKQLDFMPEYFYSQPELLNITICHALKMEDVMKQLLSDYDTLGKLDSDDKEFNFDDYLGRLEQHADKSESKQMSDFNFKQGFFKPFNFFMIGYFLFDLQRHDEAEEFFRRLYETHNAESFVSDMNKEDQVVKAKVLEQIEKQLQEFQKENQTKKHFKRFLQFYKKRLSKLTNVKLQGAMFEVSSFCFYHMNQYQTSLSHDNKALEIYQAVANANDHENIATVLDNLGVTYGSLNNHQESIRYHTKALEIYQETSLDKDNDENMARVLDHIALGERELKQCKDALHNHLLALQIYQSASIDADFDPNVARVNDNIGLVYKDLEQHEKALIFHKAALQIYKNLTSDVNSDQNVARVLDNMGVCHKNLKQYEESLVYFLQALLINQNASFEVDNDKVIAELLDNIGTSQGNLMQFEEALQHHQESLQIYEEISSNAEKDENIARVLDNIGNSYSDLEQFDESLHHHMEALKIYKNLSSDSGNDQDIARVIDNLGHVYRSLEQFEESLNCHNESLLIYKKISFDIESDRNVARLLNNVGVTERDLDQFENALCHQQKALRIYSKTSSNPDFDEDIARVLNNIGLCQRDLNQHELSLLHHKEALHIYKAQSSDIENDENVAEVCGNIGMCLADVEEFEESIIYHKKALLVFQNLKDKERHIAEESSSIGACQESLENYEDALLSYKASRCAFQSASPDEDSDENVAEMSEKIGECHGNLKQFKEAIHHQEDALRIYQNMTSDEESDENIARMFVNIGVNLASLKQYRESLNNHCRALQICRNLSSDAENNENIAQLLENIAECYRYLNQYDKSLHSIKEALHIYRNMSSDPDNDDNVVRALTCIRLCEENIKKDINK